MATIIVNPYYVSGGGGSDPDILTHLLSYYKLGEAAGNNRVDSHSTYDLVETVASAVGSAAGINGNAASFNDTDYLRYVNWGIRPAASSACSVNCWVYPANDAPQGFVGISDTAARMMSLGVNNSSVWRAAIRNTSGTVSSVTGATYTHSAWSMMTWVWDPTESGGTLRLYINGVEEGTAATGVGDWDNDQASAILFVGYGGSLQTAATGGRVDEVSIHDEALTPTQVSWLYNSGSGRTYEDLS